MRAWPVLLVIAACAGDAGPDSVAGEPVCDGLLQEGEGVVDGPWDQDGDGHYDDSNADCRTVYSWNRLDCDDQDPSVNASKLEVPCNGLDDDCSDDTPDEIDADGDGASSCDDCDDDSQLRSPLNEEVCWDGIDNNCDGRREENCGPDYSGVFQLTEAVKYQCAVGLVSIDFTQMGVIWFPPEASIYALGGSQPGTMDGTIDAEGNFVVERSVVFGMAGYCDEFYRLEGEFVDENRFVGTFTADFAGGALACLNCSGPQVFDVEAVRILAP